MSDLDSDDRRIATRPSFRVVLWAMLALVGVVVVGLLLTDSTVVRPDVPDVQPRMRRPAPMAPTLALGDGLRFFVLRWWTWFSCVATSPLYLWLVRRAPIAGVRWGRGLAAHLGVTTVVVVLTSLVWGVLARRWLGGGFPLAFDLGNFFALRYLSDSLPFWAMIAAIHALELYRRSREYAVEGAQLRARLAESRLEALSARLHPHFLFNTLQGISTLMHRDVQKADGVLSRLSDLLRRTFQWSERQEVSLAEELGVLEDYVAIAQERFGNKLVVEVSVDEAARSALVPFLVLQPLVENAIEHGVARRSETGHVRVTGECRGPDVVLSVTDDGPGVEPGEEGEGIGLSNTRERLKQLYGDRQSLTTTSLEEGGFRVVLRFPFTPAPAPAPVPEEAAL